MSASASGIVKRRPQVALAADGTVYAVWEEEAEGTVSQNGLELYYAWRDPGSGTWSVPARIPATDRVRWPAPQAVNEWYPRIQLDAAGNLHLAYSARMYAAGGTVQTSAYYLVGKDLAGAAPAWTAPARIDPSSSYQYAPEGIRLFVRPDPAGRHDAVGYVLWTGSTNNTLNLTRVAYAAAGHAARLVDASPIVNPQSITAGPVAVLERDASTLQLVYAVKNGTAGNMYLGARLTLADDGTIAWQNPAVALVGNSSEDCSQNGCPGASAASSGPNTTWVAAHWDGTTHKVQVTAHDGAVSRSVLLEHGSLSVRQPVAAVEPESGRLVVVYSTCSYVSVGACTGRDTWYRGFAGGAWSDPVPLGPTLGEQIDVSAVAGGGRLYRAWLGRNQNGTGDRVYFSVVPLA